MKIQNILLGSTNDGSLVFADINLRRRKNRESDTDIFTVSFSEVAPFEANHSLLINQVESIIHADYDFITVLMNEFDCSEDEVELRYYNQIMQIYGVEGIMDISLYSESYTIEGFENEIYFESLSCGQVDLREEVNFINKTVAEQIFKLWDKYHLKELEKEDIEIITAEYYTILGKVGNFDNRKWIREWLEINPHTIRLM